MNRHSYSTWDKSDKTPPAPVTDDHYGTPILPGRKVAFNKSGEVALGTIIALKRSEWKLSRQDWYSLKFALKIKNQDGSISTVTNPNSFVIIV